MTEVVLLVLGASFIQALGGALQKSEVAAGFGELETREFVLGFRSILGSLLRRRRWLFGFAIATAAGLGFLEAFGRADLSVVIPLATTSNLFTVGLGVVFLGERVRGSEWLALSAVIAGATLVSLDAVVTRHGALPLSTALALFVAGAAVSLLLIAARSLWPRRLSRELALTLAAAVQLGAGNLLIKSSVESIRADLGAFSATDLHDLFALLLRPEFWPFILTQVAGFVLIQAAFARGRVAVIGPLLGAGITLVSTGGAVLTLGELIPASRMAGIAALVAGTAALTWLHEPAPPRGGVATQAVESAPRRS
jgi:drug/metabolite transporter (DMT)-like permease